MYPTKILEVQDSRPTLLGWKGKILKVDLLHGWTLLLTGIAMTESRCGIRFGGGQYVRA
jgi:hypothetical protein